MVITLNGAKVSNPRSPLEPGFTVLKPLPYTTLIFGLENVLAHYSSKGLDLSVDPSKLNYILKCPHWFEHERGKLSREECFDRISKSFGVTPEDLRKTFSKLAATLSYDQGLIDLIRDLKNAAQGDLKVCLATNFTEGEWKIVGPPVRSWAIFDNVFNTFTMGLRKPDADVYFQIPRIVNTDPGRALYIDDKTENLAIAQKFGIRGIHCNESKNVIRQLKNLFGDPLLLLEITKDLILITTSDMNQRTWNYFIGQPVLTTKTHPDDLNTTTVALLSLGHAIPHKTIKSVMDEMLGYRFEEDLFYTYFDTTRPRIGIIVSANIARLFYAHNRGHQIQYTVERLVQITRTRAYEFDMRYYYYPDWFFFYLAELCSKYCPETSARRNVVKDTVKKNSELVELRSVLRERLLERMGGRAGELVDPWSAALRLSASQALGLEDHEDAEILRRTQQSDGSWGKDPWVYRYGHGITGGNAGLVTALAVRGLSRLNQGASDRAD